MPKDCGFKYGDLEFDSREELIRHFINNVPKETLLSNIKNLPNAIQEQKANGGLLRQESSGNQRNMGLQQVGEGNQYEKIAQDEQDKKEEIANENMDDENEYVGSDDTVDKMNEDRAANGVSFDEDKLRETIIKAFNKGKTEEDIIDAYKQMGVELTDAQKEIVYDVFDSQSQISPEDEKVINEFKSVLEGIKAGKKIRSVAKRLGNVAAINELTNYLYASDIAYDKISNSQLLELANTFYDRIGLEGAIDFLDNQKAGDELTDMRALLQTKVFSDLLKEGRKEEAAEVWSDMAQEATRSGRNINALSIAYSLLNAGNVDAAMKEMAIRKLSDNLNRESVTEEKRINEELGEKGMAEVKSAEQKTVEQMSKDSHVKNKIENFINRICKRK